MLFRFLPGKSGLINRSRIGRFRRYSWLCLLPALFVPVFFLAVLTLNPPVRGYLDAAKLFQSDRDMYKLQGMFKMLKHTSIVAVENLFASKPALKESALPTYRLAIQKNTLEKMQEDILYGDPALGHEPGGDKPYYKALLLQENGVPKNTKICIRGTSQWHHWPEKPSLRIKIRKAEIENGWRYLEVQRPEDALALKNWLPQRIAGELGLITERPEQVRLFINNKYFGVYLQTSRAGETLALSHNRMPGTFFKGEWVGDLWSSTEGWRLHGESDPKDVELFAAFLQLLREPPAASNLEDMRTLLNTDIYAKWAALMIVTGGAHTDLYHNHMYFLNANQGLIEAVPWDVNGYGFHAHWNTPVDIILHPVMETMTCDPQWLHARNLYIHQLLNTVASPEQLHSIIDTAFNKMRPDLQADIHLASLKNSRIRWHFVPCSVLDITEERDLLKQWVSLRTDYVNAYLNNAQVYAAPNLTRPDWTDVKVFGSATIRVESSDGTPIDSNSYAGTPDILYPGLTQELDVHPSLSYELYVQHPYAKPASVSYVVKTRADNLNYFNAITGAAVQPKQSPDVEQEITRTIHPSLFTAPRSEEVVLGPGLVTLKQDLLTNPGQKLIIKAGTHIKLHPGIGIYAQGSVQVQGAEGAEVELGPADANKPWGAFGVSGPATAGSTFTHMRVWGGSLGQRRGLRYKGMFNVYNCPNVRMAYCYFGTNSIGDDAVNLAQSHVEIEHCQWEYALSDGLDMDLCEGVLANCRWTLCGNDGLDLMGSTVTLRDAQFRECGDKGISIGENSQLLAENCQIFQCKTGLESKDASRVIFRNGLVDNAEVAVRNYQKKWMYNRGGTTILDNCRIVNSRIADADVQKRSRLELLNTEINQVLNGSNRIFKVTSIKNTPSLEEK